MTLVVADALLAALTYQAPATAATDTATASADNQYAFYVGGNHHVYEAVYDSTGWHGGSDMCSHGWGCDSVSPPAVAVKSFQPHPLRVLRCWEG